MQARPANEKDVPAIIALVTKTLAEFGIVFGKDAPTDDQLRGLPGSYEDVGGRFFVVEIDQKLAGTAGIIPLGDPQDGIFELRKMYLEPTVRGRGVGKHLFDVCVQYARAHHARRIVLDTTEQMTAAIAFYEKYGFVRDDAYISASRCSRGYRLDL